MDINSIQVLITGGGDLASGAAYRLHQCGFPLLVVEKQEPVAVRRKVAFASAVYESQVEIEGIKAEFIESWQKCRQLQEQDKIPVTTVDNFSEFAHKYDNEVYIDGRMLKRRPEDIGRHLAPLVIGLGPGFTAGENVDAVVETCRGHFLGRAIYEGSAHSYTGKPGKIQGMREERVIHAPAAGRFTSEQSIGNIVEPGQVVGKVNGKVLEAEISGVIRGLLQPGIEIPRGTKLADIDPRGQQEYVHYISDKALAVGGGVLEAILNKFTGRF